MKRIRDKVAGLDVHRDTVVACWRVAEPDGEVAVAKKTFATTSRGLAELAGWLSEAGVATVVMESTGVYWRTVYYALEGLFGELWLCNAQHMKKCRAARPTCPTPSGSRMWRRMGWCGPVSFRRRRSVSCGS